MSVTSGATDVLATTILETETTGTTVRLKLVVVEPLGPVTLIV
ncbi:hypothetical protein [Geomonas terrae]|nr:hypothetical protein [Geomonas terrae]